MEIDDLTRDKSDVSCFVIIIITIIIIIIEEQKQQ